MRKTCRAGKRAGKYFYRILILVFWAGLVFTAGYGWYYAEHQIPEHFSVAEGEETSFSLDLPLYTTLLSESEEVILKGDSGIPQDEIRIRPDQEFSLYARKDGNFRLGLKLFGTIPFKEISVNVEDACYAVPCGMPVGIYLKSRGVMVIGTGKVTDENGSEAEPAYGILQSGDYIEAINGQPLSDKEALITSLNRMGESEALLRVRRGGRELELSVDTVKTADGSRKLGAWVRDDTQGIGTMTYLKPDGGFGALGHGISDSDTGRVVEIENGALYETEILGIEKGSAGNPGVMAGVIYYGPGSRLGSVAQNTDCGIFGTAGQAFCDAVGQQTMEVGHRQDVKRGKAWIRSCVSGEACDYEIEIQRVDYSPAKENKSLVFQVTDERLLRLTGGIVQGMSGSPILQNGKLVGAVTHVFVQDSTRGYGIFVEDMLKK
ncbi:MAG: SpoIVB peptidase [Clostridiaceae bacterium]|nr:SpoIVB peptidase [Clostridiaceae bacterium]